jgi:hypothetical protein
MRPVITGPRPVCRSGSTLKCAVTEPPGVATVSSSKPGGAVMPLAASLPSGIVTRIWFPFELTMVSACVALTGGAVDFAF